MCTKGEIFRRLWALGEPRRGYGLEPDLWLSGDKSRKKVTEATSGQATCPARVRRLCHVSHLKKTEQKEEPNREPCSGAKVGGGDSVTEVPRCFWKNYQLPARIHPEPEPGKGNIPSSRYWVIRPS